jgi:hypothetical protein
MLKLGMHAKPTLQDTWEKKDMDAVEKEASDKLREEIKTRKLNAYEYMRYLSRMSNDELKSSGYRGKTQAEAVKYHLDKTEREIQMRILKHEKEFP